MLLLMRIFLYIYYQQATILAWYCTNAYFIARCLYFLVNDIHLDMQIFEKFHGTIVGCLLLCEITGYCKIDSNFLRSYYGGTWNLYRVELNMKKLLNI
jgi:hypothetical protein